MLLVHGFPDDQRMWEPVVEALPEDWHVVTYDVRGTGRSSRPTHRRDYLTELLVEDLIGVLDATLPAGERCTSSRTTGARSSAGRSSPPRPGTRGWRRLASYTSSSGPPLDHLARLTSTWRGRLRMLPQLVHSWYVLLFLLPVLPELAWRHAQGLSPPDLLRPRPDDRPAALGTRGAAQRRAGDQPLPRQRPASGSPLPWRTSVPVLLVVPLHDGFIVPRSLEHLEARCRDLTRSRSTAATGCPRARPEEFAGLVTEFVRGHPA